MCMKRVFLLSIVLFLTVKIYAQNAGVGINTTGANPHTSAMLDVSATNKGFLVPRMTMAQRIGIVSPATSLIIYQTDNLAGFYYFDGVIWKILGTGAGGTETDPVFIASPAYTIAAEDITNWNLAKSWGNHAGLYRPITYVPDWSEITNKPNLSLVATSNNYSDLLNVPWLSSGLTAYKLTGNVGIGTSKPKSKLVVQSDSLSADGAALFVVKNKYKDTVMAVYNDGIIFFINDNFAKATQGKGILVKSTSTGGKLPQQEYFRVTSDSTVLYVNDNPAKLTQGKGILVKSTSTGGKTIQNNYMSISPDSTVFYINDSPTKATQGKGILVKSTSTGGKNSTNHDYMRISPDSTNFYIRENSGNGKGFAVKTLGTNNKDLLNISSDSTAFSTVNDNKKVVVKTSSLNSSLLRVDGSVNVKDAADTLRGSIKWNGDHFSGNVNGNHSGTFVMTVDVPTLSSVTLTNMTKTTIAATANVTDDGGGFVFAKGFCWNTTGTPTRKNYRLLSSEDDGIYTDTLKNLTCNTTYYIRAFAINASGTSYSAENTFLATFAPTVTTSNINSMTSISATCGGNVTDDGCLTVTARGVCWNTTGTPTINDNHTNDGTSIGTFTSSINGITVGVTYYLRAYATNSKGTSYGIEKNFVLGVMDFDKNVYDTVRIGTQVWMKQNLKVTHFRNGDSIPNVTVWATWWSGVPAYCWYNNDINNKPIYGAIYSCYIAQDARGVCPTGYHVPSNGDWNALLSFVGGNTGALKEIGTTHWSSPNIGATNSTGFTALGTGARRNPYTNSFGDLGNLAYFWSSSAANYPYGWTYSMDTNNTSSGPGYGMLMDGYSIRCIKD